MLSAVSAGKEAKIAENEPGQPRFRLGRLIFSQQRRLSTYFSANRQGQLTGHGLGRLGYRLRLARRGHPIEQDLA